MKQQQPLNLQEQQLQEQQPAATESSQAEAPAASKAYGEGASVPKSDLSGTAATTSEAPASATEKLRRLQHQLLQKIRKSQLKLKNWKASKPLNVGSLHQKLLNQQRRKAETSSKPASQQQATTAQLLQFVLQRFENSESSCKRKVRSYTSRTTTFSATVSSPSSDHWCRATARKKRSAARA